MRVLHLIDVMSPWGGPCTQRLAADTIARLQQSEFDGWNAHDVLLIGRQAGETIANACGLNVCGSIWPLAGRTLSARGAFSRWMREARAAGSAPDLIHAWTASAGALAAMAAGEIPRAVTPRPLAADVDSPNFIPRDDVRQRWLRDEGIALDEFVLGLIGEPPECFDARAAMHVSARTGLSSRRIRMIMSGRTFARAESERFLRMLNVDQVLVQDEATQRPWEIMRGLDAALSIAPAPSRHWHGRAMSSLPVLLAQAAEVPLLVEADAPHDGLIKDEVSGLMFPAGDLNAACLRLSRLHDEPSLAGRLTEAGRRGMVDRFSIHTLCKRLDSAYQQAIEHGRAEYVQPASIG